ncbi:MAG: hypothetical protein CMJ59_07850 [Planctomycetaceae bacterium]|nr:hypothetical protein [Planctomycetaceae bacterium]
MSPPEPIRLTRIDDDFLVISWSDQQDRRYAIRELRDRCPCATCRQREEAPTGAAEMFPIVPGGAPASLRIERMTPVGSYAYSIEFSDGHDTGIYAFELLRTLGEKL